MCSLPSISPTRPSPRACVGSSRRPGLSPRRLRPPSTKTEMRVMALRLNRTPRPEAGLPARSRAARQRARRRSPVDDRAGRHWFAKDGRDAQRPCPGRWRIPPADAAARRAPRARITDSPRSTRGSAAGDSRRLRRVSSHPLAGGPPRERLVEGPAPPPTTPRKTPEGVDEPQYEEHAERDHQNFGRRHPAR